MSLLKKLRKSRAIRRLASFFITQYVKLVWLTSRWEILGKEYSAPQWRQTKPMITCFWHGRLLMMFKAWGGQNKLHMLISSHPDGEIIARTTQSFGYGWIAGSSTRGGQKAFLKIVKVLKNGEAVGVTPDGPRGPRYQANPGVIQMARLAGVDILPVSYSSTRGIFMKSWDRFFLPFPFGRGVFVFGPMIEATDSSKSEEELCEVLNKSLRDLTRKADLHCGQEIDTLLKEEP